MSETGLITGLAPQHPPVPCHVVISQEECRMTFWRLRDTTVEAPVETLRDSGWEAGCFVGFVVALSEWGVSWDQSEYKSNHSVYFEPFSALYTYSYV